MTNKGEGLDKKLLESLDKDFAEERLRELKKFLAHIMLEISPDLRKQIAETLAEEVSAKDIVQRVIEWYEKNRRFDCDPLKIH